MPTPLPTSDSTHKPATAQNIHTAASMGVVRLVFLDGTDEEQDGGPAAAKARVQRPLLAGEPPPDPPATPAVLYRCAECHAHMATSDAILSRVRLLPLLLCGCAPGGICTHIRWRHVRSTC
jgi:hypothetical protein